MKNKFSKRMLTAFLTFAMIATMQTPAVAVFADDGENHEGG